MNRGTRSKAVIAAVTQRMVSQRAGVSQVTVSHILGDKGANYSAQTRERVRLAAESLGYRPNRAAQMMRRGRSNAIVHLNYSGYSELAGQKSYHLGRFVHEAGFDYQIIDSYWWPEEGSKMINRILSLRPEGLVVSGSLQTKIDFRDFPSAGIAVVALDVDLPGAPRIRHDIRRAIAELTRQCLAQGRRPVLLLKKNPMDTTQLHWTIAARREGFLDALREYGLDKVPEFIVGGSCFEDRGGEPAIIWHIQKSSPYALFESGEQAARWLLKASALPDALICTNDFYAIGILGVLTSAGLRVPQDVAVAGFDNLSYSMQQAVSLTSVEHPIEAMCAEAIALLQKQIRAQKPLPEIAAIKTSLPCRIHWRRSLPQEILTPSAASHHTPVPALEI